MRQFSKEKYIIAAILTIGIFLMGLFLGLVIEGKRIGLMDDMYRQQSVDFGSSQMQYDYLTSLDDNSSCSTIVDAFDKNIAQLDETRIRLVNYARQSKLNKDSFNILKREYTLEQIKYWQFSSQTRDSCNSDLVRILYFYSTDDNCPMCGEEEFILNYIKKRFQQNVLIFALDSDFEEEPLIGILKKRYNVTQFPTLVFEDESVSGFSSKEKVLSKICDNLHNDYEDCTVLEISNQSVLIE